MVVTVYEGFVRQRKCRRHDSTVSVSERVHLWYWLYFNPLYVIAGKALMNTDQSTLASLRGANLNVSATSFSSVT